MLLALAPVYENQEAYRTLGTALARATMTDMQRRGVLPVSRDGFADFIPLERDFANRERQPRGGARPGVPARARTAGRRRARRALTAAAGR